MNEDLMSLDELFAEAKRVMREKPPKEEPAPSKIGGSYAAPASALFANEANWHSLRIVALMHEDSGAFLGNFEEFEHNTVPDAHKLKRLTQPNAQHVDVVYVNGPGYLEFKAPESNTHAPDLTRLRCQELELESPPVHAQVVNVCVVRSAGGIIRITLEHETTFMSKEVLLTLPAGTDILPSLSLQSKKLIKGML